MKKATRQQYASAAKARRQKQILAVLGVVLVAVLVIQGPKMLNMMSGSSSTPSPTTPTATTATPGTTAQPSSAAPLTATLAPGLAGAGLAASPSGVADASPARSKSQIYSFERFDSKNPFVQQVTTPTTPPPTVVPPTPTPSTPAPAAKGTTSSSGGTTPVTASYASQPQAVSAVSTTTGTALISVNGKSEMVAPGQAFPSANPTFKLVSIANGTALIGLVGGTYASGTATVTLVQGQALTLLDTTDGVRYQLQLDALSAK
jgi:hypothetical protein